MRRRAASSEVADGKAHTMALTNSNKQADGGGAAKAAGQGESTGSVGLAVAQARRAAGLTQRDLADKLEVRLWQVDEWEAGAKPIPPDQIGKIATAIGTTPEQLFGREPEPVAAKDAQPEQAVEAAQPEAAAAQAPRQPEAAAAPQPAPPAPEAASVQQPAPPPQPRQVSGDQIRKAELPRSLRGYDERATRKLLAEIAVVYERVLGERDEARKRAADLETTSPAQEPAELEATEQTTAEDGAVVAERDELQRRVAELEAKLAGRDESEQMLTRALLAAGRAGEELVKQAQTEADAIVAAARAEAEQVGRELEERRASIEKERDSVRRQLRREALASARGDLEQLHREAEPVLEGLLSLSDRLRALIWPDSGEPGPDGELLEDLRPSAEQEPEAVADDVD